MTNFEMCRHDMFRNLEYNTKTNIKTQILNQKRHHNFFLGCIKRFSNKYIDQMYNIRKKKMSVDATL